MKPTPQQVAEDLDAAKNAGAPPPPPPVGVPAPTQGVGRQYLILPPDDRAPGDLNHSVDHNMIVDALKALEWAYYVLAKGPQGEQGVQGEIGVGAFYQPDEPTDADSQTKNQRSLQKGDLWVDSDEAAMASVIMTVYPDPAAAAAHMHPESVAVVANMGQGRPGIIWTDATGQTFSLSGIQGATGATGPVGPAPTLRIGAVTDVGENGTPTATITPVPGQAGTYTVSFGLKRGAQGARGQVGQRGPQGIDGPVGPQGPRGVVSAKAPLNIDANFEISLQKMTVGQLAGR